jgi:uncharacterized protein (DUF427 family)
MTGGKKQVCGTDEHPRLRSWEGRYVTGSKKLMPEQKKPTIYYLSIADINLLKSGTDANTLYIRIHKQTDIHSICQAFTI